MSGEGVRLFVYGSLLEGEPAHGLLDGAERLGGARTAEGYALFDFGEWPAMVAGGAGRVRGEVYRVSAELLGRLDAYEEHPEFFERVSVGLDDGSRAEAYLLPREEVGGRPLIESGDWRAPRQRA